MSTARQRELISVEEYLDGESVAEVRHEFVEGVVYAMVGATNAHNLMTGNFLYLLQKQLDHSPCRAFNPDTKVRIRSSAGTRFYDPDAQVVCEQNPQSDTFQDQPVFVFEVLSDSTRRADEGEKKESYLSIASLNGYAMFEQNAPFAIVYVRTDVGFDRVVCEGIDSELELSDLDLKMSFRDVYRDIQIPDAS